MKYSYEQFQRLIAIETNGKELEFINQSSEGADFASYKVSVGGPESLYSITYHDLTYAPNWTVKYSAEYTRIERDFHSLQDAVIFLKKSRTFRKLNSQSKQKESLIASCMDTSCKEFYVCNAVGRFFGGVLVACSMAFLILQLVEATSMITKALEQSKQSQPK